MNTMKFYLDERIVVPVTIGVPNTGTYIYNVKNNNNVLFVGNIFIKQNSLHVDIDVTDIIRGQLTTPSFFESFPLQQSTLINTTYQSIYEIFQVSININGTNFYSDIFEVYMYYRYPLMKDEMNNDLQYVEHTAILRNKLWVSLQGRYSSEGNSYLRLTPHYPYNLSLNYGVAIAGFCTSDLLNNSNTNIVLNGIYDVDEHTNKTQQIIIKTVNYCAVIPLESLFDDTYIVPDSDYSIWFRNNEIAKIDICPAKYYLMWQDRAGSFQSQPFDKVSTYSEKFDREYITNYKGVKRVTTITNSPKIKIQTGYIDEKIYPYYESIFTSPYLLLYDTKEDKSYLVNITGNYTEKTFKNQNRQMFNIQLDLEFAKNQNIIY